MISKVDCLNLLITRFPQFQLMLLKLYEDWLPEKPGFCLEVEEFAKFVKQEVQEHVHGDTKRFFELIEQLMIEGSTEVQDAVATCFLESFPHDISHIDDRDKFFGRLGSASLAYCQAYDAFTGAVYQT